MSIKAMTRVWEESKQRGGALLLLLAIADYAKDDGTGAWPSIKKLAQKTRMSERNVQKLLRKLEADGELVTHHAAGPKTRHGPTNLYDLTLRGERGDTPQKQGVNVVTPQGVNVVTPQGVNVGSPDPSCYPSLIHDEDESEAITFNRVMQTYHENINISEAPITIQEMQSDRYAALPPAWWIEAIEIAAANNARRWSYIRGILERSIEAGVSPKKCKPKPARRGQQGEQPKKEKKIVRAI